ncbi:hypothetical protein GCM10027258_80390 [Amycolatopsis stemonae]
MPETDRNDTPHYPPRYPELFSPRPPRRRRVVAGLLTVLVSAAVVAVAFVLLTALNHVGRAVQHDVNEAVVHAVDHIADRIGDRIADRTHCGPPAGR